MNRWIAIVALLAGCASSSSGDGAGADAAGAVLDGAQDAEPVADGDAADGVASGDAPVDATPAAPVAAPSEPVPVTPSAWMVAIVPPGGDAVGAAIEAGTFTLPAPGLHDGVVWKEVTLGEGGALSKPAPGWVIYAATTLHEEAPTTLIARADGFFDLLLDGARQPGDIYLTRGQRVPLRAPAGDSLLVLRGVGRGGAPEVELSMTPDEVLLHAADLTAPTLVAGEQVAQPLGIPVLSLLDAPILDVVIRVLPSEHLAETTTRMPGLVPLATTHLTALLEPSGPLPAEGTPLEVTVRLESPSLAFSYELTVPLVTAAPTANPVTRTFVSPMDASAQLYGLLRPAGTPDGPIGLVLSLHGAGVQGPGQAAAYGAKAWTALVAPTNRRAFGFDWEAWGRRDALEVLDHAMATLPVDPTQVWLTGHSMGGHGTWQLGTLFPGRFAVVGPSAGWISFETYGGETFPDGPLGWARASSDTLRWAENLARRAVYVIHGTADDNVPIGEAQTMVAALEPIVPDLQTHWQEGAGHWWDGDAGAGADCVDWPPLFETMQQRALDPLELDFSFRSPSPWVSPSHSYVTLRSLEDPSQDMVAVSAVAGSTVTLTTTNVRSLVLDGAGLRGRGVTSAVVDGQTHDVPDGPLAIGPQTGKRPGVGGPFNEVLERPWCAVWPDDAVFARRWAAWLVSHWAVLGNGQACGLPLSAVTSERRAGRNLLYVLPSAAEASVPFAWSASAITVASQAHEHAAGLAVFPDGDALSAVIVATAGDEALLWRFQPFTSRFVAPDFMVWGADGLRASGFWTADWIFDPAFAAP